MLSPKRFTAVYRKLAAAVTSKVVAFFDKARKDGMLVDVDRADWLKMSDGVQDKNERYGNNH